MEHIKESAVPRIKSFGAGGRRFVQAQQVWLVLVAHVMHLPKETITYGELAEKMKMSRLAGRTLNIPLGIVGEYCRVNNLPTLNSIVVNQETGVPGDHVVVRNGRTYKDEQDEVAETDWFNYRVPTTGTFRRVWESQR